MSCGILHHFCGYQLWKLHLPGDHCSFTKKVYSSGTSLSGVFRIPENSRHFLGLWIPVPCHSYGDISTGLFLQSVLK